MLCKSCGSFRQFIGQCPDSHEQKKEIYATEDVTREDDDQIFTENESEDVERFVLYILDTADWSKFTPETINLAALDTAGTTSLFRSLFWGLLGLLTDIFLQSTGRQSSVLY